MEERSNELGTHADPHHGKPKFALEMGKVQGSKVGEFHPLEVTPEPFVRVELGSIRRELLDMESGAGFLDEVADRHGPMGVEIVPNQNDGAVDVTQEVAQENEHLCCGDGTDSDEDKEPGVGAYPRDGRELRPRIPVDEDGSLAARHTHTKATPGRHRRGKTVSMNHTSSAEKTLEEPGEIAGGTLLVARRTRDLGDEKTPGRADEVGGPLHLSHV